MSKAAARELVARGIDVVHVDDVDLRGRPDDAVLRRAIADGRIVVTRNYADFAKLAEAAAVAGLRFPGILFLPRSLAPDAVGAHVRAIESWVTETSAGRRSVANTIGWLIDSDL